jgi:hypothetical protein
MGWCIDRSDERRERGMEEIVLMCGGFTLLEYNELRGMEWNGMEWNGMEWNGMEWNGME